MKKKHHAPSAESGSAVHVHRGRNVRGGLQSFAWIMAFGLLTCCFSVGCIQRFPGDPCLEPEDCLPHGLKCQYSFCVPGCTDNADCLFGTPVAFRCYGSYCILWGQFGGTCPPWTDVGEGWLCNMRHCNAASPCDPEGLYDLECIHGLCQPKRCSDDSDCPSDDTSCYKGHCWDPQYLPKG
jgi:hypothetical protein